MSLFVIFLGTAGSVPTPKRSLPAILVKRKNEYMLFDCGEGVQRQMLKGKLGFHKKMKIFITHMHGDHVLGLPGLLQSMSLFNRKKKLQIYGPPGIKLFLEGIRESVRFALTFQVEIYEIEKTNIVCEEDEYVVKSIWTNHVIPNLAYALVEKPRYGKFYPEKAKALGIPEGNLWSKLQRGHIIKLKDGRKINPQEVVGPPRQGRKIVYTGDTRGFKDIVKFAANADLLIYDSTLDDTLYEKAEEDGHSTPSQSALNAKKAKVKKLILTHISARYKDTTILLEQAVKIFKNTRIAKDFTTIEIPLLDS
jgi:ribonuclease Z